MNRKKLILAFVVFAALISCEKNGKAKGYFKVLNSNVSDNQVYNKNPHYFRVNDDTLVSFTLKDLKIDSTRFVWNGKWYDNYDDKVLNSATMDFPEGSQVIYVDVFKMGNKRYDVIDENNITFSYDTTKSETKTLGKELFDLIYKNKDTLQKVDKRYITTALKKDIAKDSLLFHKPFVTEDVARAEIIPYLLQNYNDSFQKINPESLEVFRMDDNKFRINFQVKRSYGGTSDYKFEMVFAKESYKLQMK